MKNSGSLDSVLSILGKGNSVVHKGGSHQTTWILENKSRFSPFLTLLNSPCILGVNFPSGPA